MLEGHSHLTAVYEHSIGPLCVGAVLSQVPPPQDSTDNVGVDVAKHAGGHVVIDCSLIV